MRATSKPVVALLAAALLQPACGPRPGTKGTGRGVLVIVVDALRADHVGHLGYDRKTTPYLDALAAGGTSFSAAFTASPEALASHAAILSGCDPMLARRIPIDAPSRGTAATDWYLPDELPRLPRAFLAAGYSTAAFVDHPAISPVCGFGAGFQRFLGYSTSEGDESARGYAGVSARFLNWISGLDRSQDWFAYVQFDDLERLWLRPDQKWDTFFEPRPELSSVPPIAEDERVYFALPRGRWDGGSRSIGQLEARYDGALCNLDQNLGRLFEKLRRNDRWDATTVVVVGSHGVGFGESGVIAETGTFSDCDLRVPWIVRPGAGLTGVVDGAWRGGTTNGVVSLIDLAPTLLDLHGTRGGERMGGHSLAGLFRGPSFHGFGDPVFAAGGLQAGFAAIDDHFCYEESFPGALEQEAVSPLSRSWYGDDLDHSGDVRQFLHDRQVMNVTRGHLGKSSHDEEARARLSRAGHEHYEWIEKARAVLQAGPGEREAFDPALLAELEKRGLLGEGLEVP